MKRTLLSNCLLISQLFLSSAAAPRAAEASALRLLKTIPLPGVEGRFDHFALDAGRGRLFVAALGNDTLEVMDVAGARRIKSVAGLHMPTGVWYVPGTDRVYVGNGRDGSLKILRGGDYSLEKSIPDLPDADNVRFDAEAGKIYVGYGDGALAIVDTRNNNLQDRLPIKGHPESFRLETNGSRIFVNVPQARQIEVLDREQRRAVATWPLEDVQANFPMFLHEPGKRLFVGCRRPPRLLVLNTDTGARVAETTIHGDTDDLYYDAKRRRLYISCGEGFIDVVAEDGDRYPRVESIPTAPGARTSWFSPELDRYFLAVPHRGSQAAVIRVYRPAERTP